MYPFMTLSLTSCAKLNLSLNVIGKRTDGYHLLHSVVAFAQIGDTITVIPADEIRCDVTGRYAAQTPTDDNLVVKAARLLATEAHITSGCHITIEKNLPVASGIGGGSGDAAATLHALNTLWNCGYSLSELSRFGLHLGADIPVCLHNSACVMQGIGEEISPLPAIQNITAILINPGIALETRHIFSNQPV